MIQLSPIKFCCSTNRIGIAHVKFHLVKYITPTQAPQSPHTHIMQLLWDSENYWTQYYDIGPQRTPVISINKFLHYSYIRLTLPLITTGPQFFAFSLWPTRSHYLPIHYHTIYRWSWDGRGVHTTDYPASVQSCSLPQCDPGVSIPRPRSAAVQSMLG